MMRAELTALERDEQVAEWIRLSVLSLSQAGTNSPGRPTTVGARNAEREGA